MATRTISATGGNFNATSAWVEGVVPTSADVVVGNATSNNLTVNVSSACSNLNLANYTKTLTINALLTVSGTDLLSSFGASMTFAGTTSAANFLAFSSAHVLKQDTTSEIPNLGFHGSNTKVLLSDIYTQNCLQNGQSGAVVNSTGSTTYSVYVRRQIGGSGGTKHSYNGSAVLRLVCTQSTVDNGISLSLQGTMSIDTEGTIYTDSGGFSLTTNASNQNPSLTITKAKWYERSGLYVTSFGGSSATFSIDSSVYIPFVNLSHFSGNATTRRQQITLLKPLNVGTLMFLDLEGIAAALSRTFSHQWYIRNNGVSASTLVSAPTNYGIFPGGTAGPTYFQAPNILLESGFTHSFGNIEMIGGAWTFTGYTKPLFSSITPSVVTNIVVGSRTSSVCIDYNFQDINASGGIQVIALNSTLTNTTNIITTYPFGGASTFVN